MTTDTEESGLSLRLFPVQVSRCDPGWRCAGWRGPAKCVRARSLEEESFICRPSLSPPRSPSSNEWSNALVRRADLGENSCLSTNTIPISFTLRHLDTPNKRLHSCRIQEMHLTSRRLKNLGKQILNLLCLLLSIVYRSKHAFIWRVFTGMKLYHSNLSHQLSSWVSIN